MSEFQYYEFQAIDRPLSEADRQSLRDLSTRARITSTSFTNSYEWGDFKGNPDRLMEMWFDLHLYLANFGSRRLMIRLPKRLIDRQRLDGFLQEVDCAKLRVAGDNVILDIGREEVESDDWDDGSGWLAAIAPLRADLMAGDWRMFYLLWLTAVEDDGFEEDEPEPMAGIGPLTGALEAFASFFGIDPDLVAAAAERPAVAIAGEAAARAVRDAIAAMGNAEKTAMLVRLFDGDPHVAAELRAKIGDRMASGAAPPVAARTVGDLRARARALAVVREQAAAAKIAAERLRQAQAAEKSRQERLIAIRRRGESVWREVSDEIERRSAAGYDNATALLTDLKAVAEEQGSIDAFRRRLRTIRDQHARKEKLIQRLAGLG